MPVLARYVVRTVLIYTLLVTSIFVFLSGLYRFMTQQDEIGIGNYQVPDALLFVACDLPFQAFTLLPICALIGALLALGNLARASELIVMRAAGVSVFRLARWVGAAGAILAVLTWILGDYVAPPLEQFAYRYKTMAKYSELSAIGRELRAKDGNTFISVHGQVGDASFGGVYVLRFDDQRRLVSVARAERATPGPGQQWTLHNYLATRFLGNSTQVVRQASATLATTLSAEFLETNVSVLTGAALWAYIDHLRSNGLDSREAEIALWTRVARTAALFVIVILAVPFAFGPMRSTGAGARTVVGILIGAGFFLLAKLLENGGAVFDLPPLAIAWGPTGILAAVTALAISRVR